MELDPARRSDFLAQACAGEQSLREEVESLLAQHSDAKRFMEASAIEMVAVALAEDQKRVLQTDLVGRTLSHHRIVEKLGAGGMAVVYKAVDTRLNRQVALKVLSSSGIADSQRKRRFTKEAKAASALNHPSIVTIYEIDEAEGFEFIAMEYVAGKTLDRQIPSRGMPFDTVVELGVQMADALAAAHSAGIIHRDLKPSNVMISDSGQVKILDFGLAKLIEGAERRAGKKTPSESSLRSEEGMIVGTVAYMSPEQAEGKKVDARSDIFSLGAVLYEMVSGQRPFVGDGPMSTLAAIVRDEPKPLGDVARGIPVELEKVIRRCLRKEPERRFQSMSDVKVELLEVKEELELRREPGLSHRRRSVRWIAAGVCITVLAVVVGWWLLRSEQKPAPVLIAVPFTTYPGSELAPAFSADGNQVAFRWNGENEDNWDIYVKNIGSDKPLRLTSDPAADFSPCWSPDGKQIGFLRIRNKGFAIFTIPFPGGVERKVYETRYVTRPEFSVALLTWTPDSKGFVISERDSPSDPNALFLVLLVTGEKRRLTSPPQGFNGDADPAFSPDGSTLAFSRNRDLGQVNLCLFRLSPEFKAIEEPRVLTDHMPFKYRDIFGHAWSPDGKEIVASIGRGTAHQSQLWMIPVRKPDAARRLEFTGIGASYPAISVPARRLAFNVAQSVRSSWILDDTRDSTIKAVPRKILASTRWDNQCQVSPDGNKIALRSDRSGAFNIWVCRSDGSQLLMLTSFNGPECGSPGWSADSRWITFDARPEGQSEVYIVSAEGGPLRRMTEHSSEDLMPCWSRDGRWVYFTSNRTGQWQVWKMPAAGGQPIQVTRKGGFYAQESFDGKTLFFGKGRYELGVFRMPVGGTGAAMFLPDADITMFTPASQGFYFWTGRDLTFLDYQTGARRIVAVIERTPCPFLSAFPDGRRILYSQTDHASSDLYLVENFR